MARILMVIPRLPFPPHDGDSLRHYNLIRRLSAGCQIDLIAFANGSAAVEGSSELRKYCSSVIAVPYHAHPRAWWLRRYAVGLCSGMPLAVGCHYLPEMRSAVCAMASQNAYDVIHTEHTFMARYMQDAARVSSAPTVLGIQNIESLKIRQLVRIERAWKQRLRYAIDACLMPAEEHRAISSPDACVTVSEVNARAISRMFGRKDVVVVENGVDTTVLRRTSRPDGPPTVLFVGTLDYGPNVDAVRFLASEILPLVRQELPNVVVNVVGRKPCAEVIELAGHAGMRLHPDAPEIMPWYRSSHVAVVPLRAGGGTRLKILESMALGVPVVSTSVGCDGLEVRGGSDLIVADEPRSFATQVCRLLLDRAYWERIALSGRQLVERAYSWDHIAPKLLSVYDDLLRGVGIATGGTA